MNLKNVYYGWWVVLAGMVVAAFSSGIIFFGFTAFLEPIVHDFGWTYTQISFIGALRGLNMGIFAPVAGLLVDRFGSRIVVFLGIITMSLGLILTGFTHSFYGFFATFLLISFGSGGCTSVVLMTAVANWFNRDIGKAMGLVTCGFGGGGLLVPLNVWLIDTCGWRVALWILGGAILAVGLPAALVIRNRETAYDAPPNGLSASPARPEAKSEEEHHPDFTVKQAVRNGFYWQVAFAEVVRMAAAASVAMHVMPYLGSLGFSRTRAGLVASAIPLISIVGRFGFGWLGDIYDKKKVLLATLACTALGLLAFAYLRITWLIIPLLILYAPGFGGGTTMRGAIIRDSFGLAAMGRLLGIIMGLSAISGLVGPMLSGWVYDTYGTYHYVWLAFTVILAASTILLGIIKTPALHR